MTLNLKRRNLLLYGAAATLATTTGTIMAQTSPGKTRIELPAGQRRAFDRERFIEDCINAHMETDPVAAVRDVLAAAVSDHRSVLNGLGDPTEAGLDVLLRSPTLTIFAAAWTPQMYLLPHDHKMWALIGIYTGREDNILWHREKSGIEAESATCLFEGDVATLEPSAIHSVTNPLLRFTGGIHIYGGDFFATERSQWDPETLAEQPSDGDVIKAIFARENERYKKVCS